MTPKLILVLLTTNLLLGCARGPISLRFGGDEDQAKQNQNQTNQKTDPTDALISFQEINDKVFSQNCQACHSKELPHLSSYEEYKNNSADIFQEVVVLKTMPRDSALSAEQISLVKKWIEQGSPELSNISPEPKPPEEKKLSFEDLKASFFEAKCIKCHHAPKGDTQRPGRKLKDFSSYTIVVDNIDKIFSEAVIESAMPPAPDEEATGENNPNRLSNEEKDILYRWIRDGMTETTKEKI